MSRPVRIICYAINGAGMGHVTRLLGVARWMRRLITFMEGVQPEILFLTSSDASDMLADARFAAFKIPSKTVARTAALEKMEYRRLAKHFIWQTLGVFAPDLLVVDTFPSGSFDELFQVLDGPFKKAFIHRNVKSDYASRPTFRAAMGFYDTVVIPHRAEPESANATQDVRADNKSNSVSHHYTGEVIQFEREQLPDRQTSRRELGIDDHKKLIYVSAGGGGDPTAEECLRKIIEPLSKDERYHLLVGAGPLYRGRRFAGPQITWCESSAIWRFFTGCDAAVSAGGYNTFHELLYAGIPALFYAQEKIADDQWLRVQSAQKQNACLTLESLDNPEELRRAVARLLDPIFAANLRANSQQYVAENGALKCAVELIRPLFPQQRLELAVRALQPAVVHQLEKISGGDADLIAHWLTAVYPQGRIQQLADSHGLETVLQQLSPDAAAEVRSVLQRAHGNHGLSQLEEALLDLLNHLRQKFSESEARNLGDEVFRCFIALTKKYPALTGNTNREWSQWASAALLSLRKLLQHPLGLPAEETLKLFRAFPKLEDVSTPDELSDAFIAYVESRFQAGEQPHDVLRHLQVLKMSQALVTRDSLNLPGESVR
jgi:predicted glycosyltransferase